MSYRVSRKTTSNTFRVGDQLCRVTFFPWYEYQPGHWIWNVGFCVGKSRRQLNDWYHKRKNKRTRGITKKITGRAGIATISRGFQTVLQMRWIIPPGDLIVLDCTSGNPEQQFKAWSRWHRNHPEWLINFEEKKFFWYRPPYPDDALWKSEFKIIPETPADPLANTVGERYFDCFRVRLKDPRTDLSMDQMLGLLGQVLNS